MKSEHIQEIMVISPFYPPHTGGLQTHADELNRHLADKGYTMTVLTSHLPRESATHETVDSRLTIFRLPVWEIIGNYPLPAVWLPRFWRLVASVRRHRPDLIISRTRFFVSSLIALLLAKLYRVPLIHVEHGSDFVQLTNPISRTLARLYDHTFGRLVLRQASHVVANSIASKNFVTRLSGRSDVRVIYRGINKEILEHIPAHPTLRQEYPQKLLVTYIGRLIDGKGVPILLQALANMRDRGIQCLIIGDGPARAALTRLCKQYNLNHQVTFYGDQPWTNAMAYLKSSDVFVNPSYTEGLPTGVIEAALCGRMIIATNVGGTPEVITHAESGLLISPGNVEQLVSALREAKNPRRRQILGEQAAHTVASRFNWAHTTTMYHELIQEMQLPT